MNMPKQVLLLCTVCLAAICIEAVLPIAVPSSVIAMLIVLVLMLTHVIKPPHLEGVAGVLQGYMGFFFMPTCVSILQELDIMREHGVAIVLICFVGTVATFGVTALATTLLLKVCEKKGDRS